MGFPLDTEAAVMEAGRVLLGRGAHTAIIKLEGRGIYWTDGEALEWGWQPGP